MVGGVRTVQMLQTSTVQYFVSKIYWGLSVGTGSVYLEIRHVHIVPVTDCRPQGYALTFMEHFPTTWLLYCSKAEGKQV